MGNLSGYGIYKLGGSGGGGGANTLYTADGTIGSGRVATVTDTVTFESVNSFATRGGFVFKPALNGGGANEYAIISYGTREWFWHYRANETYGFGMTNGNTTSQFLFNHGALNNGALIPAIFYINGDPSKTNTLYIKGGGATDATTSLLIENSAATESFKLTDASEATIKNNVASPLNALTLENEAGGATHANCGVKLQLTNNADTGFIAQYDSVGGGTSAPTMWIESPTGINYKANAVYRNGYHNFETDNAVGFAISRDTNSAILRSILAGGGGNYTELQLAYTGGDYNFIKSQHNSGGKFIFGRENGGSFEYMRIAEDGEVLIGTPTTDASALLNVSSTTKGFLQPRMTGAQVEAISSPATGLQAYATNAGAGDVTAAGWWGYDGANWVQGFSGGGGSSIYTADGTIGSGRIATLTDDLTFQGVGAIDTKLAINNSNTGALTRTRWNNQLAVGTLGTTGTQLGSFYQGKSFILGFNSQDLVISTATTDIDFVVDNASFTSPTLKMKVSGHISIPNSTGKSLVVGTGTDNTYRFQVHGGSYVNGQTKIVGTGSTSATSSLKLEDSAGNRQLEMFDSGLLALETQSSTGANLSFYSAGGGSLIATFQKTSSTGLLLNMRSSGTTFFYTRDLYTSFPFWGGTWRGVKIGGANAAPDLSACLELDSTTKGFLPSRMTTVQMNAISSPATGLMVYDTTTNQWMGYNGTSWIILG